MIYIIGDSHVSVFSGTDKTYEGLRHIQPEFGTCYTLSLGQIRSKINRFEQRIPYFCPIKIGSYTAYNSFNKLPKIEHAILEYGVSKNDYVFISFGEIDIRNHIGFNADRQGITFEEGIKICVDRYLKTILFLKNKNIKIGVYAPPASSIGNQTPDDYGDIIFRNKMTLIFNAYLGEKCKEYKINFVDISKSLILEDGTTDQKFIMDDIHLSQQAMPLLKEAFSVFVNEKSKN